MKIFVVTIAILSLSRNIMAGIFMDSGLGPLDSIMGGNTTDQTPTTIGGFGTRGTGAGAGAGTGTFTGTTGTGTTGTGTFTGPTGTAGTGTIGTGPTGTGTGTFTGRTGTASTGTIGTGPTGTGTTGTRTGIFTGTTGAGTGIFTGTGGGLGTGTVVTGAPDFGGDRLPLLGIRQRQLNALCALKCKTEVCYLADETDCRNFITCDQDPRGEYRATLQPCAFGTYWAGLELQKKITCDVPENVHCKIDYCAGKPNGATYAQKGGNCKTYWKCQNGNPVPECCLDGYRYNILRGECVRDIGRTCNDVCPIKIDVCLDPSIRTEFFDDGICSTYWSCLDLHPTPVCCPDGQAYDAVNGCIDSPLCTGKCPPQYQRDQCLSPQMDKYSLIDGYCRTYMKCNATEGDERWCCPSGHVFDSNSQSCILKEINIDYGCSDHCPRHYKEVCELLPVFNRSDVYLEEIFGTLKERPCAPGTHFSQELCGCGKSVKNAPDNSCSKELDIIFDRPYWIRNGSQKMTKIDNFGPIEDGPLLDGRITYKFNGRLFFRIPFFQQAYQNLYVKIIYFPEGTTTLQKQVVLSNCLNLDLGEPSMELYLRNGRVFLDLVTDALQTNATSQRATASVNYTPGIWNSLTAIYDGQNVRLLNRGAGVADYDVKPLTGTIQVAAEGLDFGGCYMYRDLNEGFKGSLGELQFSKCLHYSWVDRFNTNIPSQTTGVPTV